MPRNPGIPTLKEDKPCSKCGQEPREPGVSWGKKCLQVANTERRRRRGQSLPRI